MITSDLRASIGRKFRRSLRKRGFLKTLLFLAGRTALLLVGYRRPPGISEFDRRYGTDTWREVKLNELEIESPNVKFGIHYTTPPVELVTEAFSKLEVRHEDFTFIDMGSGKGMGMLLASTYPFAKIVGVEFSRELIEIAKANVRKYDRHNDPGQKCHNFEFIHLDATEYSFPPIPLVIEFSNPFVKDVMRTVVDRLAASLREVPREVWVVYVNPVEHLMFDENPLLTICEHNAEYAVYRHIPQPLPHSENASSPILQSQLLQLG